MKRDQTHATMYITNSDQEQIGMKILHCYLRF